MTRSGGIVGTILFMLFGPIVWAVHLGVSYALHAALCAADDRLPLSPSDLPWLLGGATAIAALALAAALAIPGTVRTTLRAVNEGEQAAFATTVMRILSLLSLFGVAYFGLAMLVVPVCLPLR